MKRTVGLVTVMTMVLVASSRADTTIDPRNHHAWGANIGFTDWRPSMTDGVNIGPNFCAGFIYAANLGWIKMGTGNPSNGTSYSNTSASDFGVNCSTGAAGEKNMRGFAYGANIGWINFEGTGNPRVILSTGQLRGFVWSANGGWINLDDATVFVQTAAAPPTATPTPSPTPTATATATATPAVTATATPTATASATPTATPTATSTAIPTATPAATATATPTATPTATSTAIPTATPAATATATPTATPTATATAIPTATPAATATATPTSISHLANISTRLQVQTGDNILIVGFIIEGNNPKTLIVRGRGPSLPVPGPLADPTLELYQSGVGLIAMNDDWTQNSNAAEIILTGVPPTNPKESALLTSLTPGSYTAVLRGNNNGTGIGSVELYDLDTDGPAKLVNLATRGFVLGGDDVMIAGLIITGNDPSQLVIRAIGPSLAGFGLPNVLADPLIELHNGDGAIIFINDNWRESQEAAIQATGLAPGDNLESAIFISLIPGNYTAIVKGAAGGIGNGLVEIYKLAP